MKIDENDDMKRAALIAGCSIEEWARWTLAKRAGEIVREHHPYTSCHCSFCREQREGTFADTRGGSEG